MWESNPPSEAEPRRKRFEAAEDHQAPCTPSAVVAGPDGRPTRGQDQAVAPCDGRGRIGQDGKGRSSAMTAVTALPQSWGVRKGAANKSANPAATSSRPIRSATPQRPRQP